MSYEIEETGDLSRRAQVSVSADEFNRRINKALNELSKHVDIRGFRKGKVPMNVMKKRYGDSVEQDVVQELVRDKIEQIISETDQPVIHLGSPEVDVDKKDDEGFEFSIDYELRPEIDPIGYMGLELEREKIEVERDEIDARLEQMRQQYATLEPIEFRETIAEGDVVTFDYRALGDDEELEEFEGENAQIEVGQGQALEGLEEGLLGADFDSTVVVEITPDEHFPVEELRNKSFELEVDIKSVKKQVLPELDDEFAKDTGEAETLLELRGQIREELEEEREHQSMHRAEDQLVEKLLEQNEMDLPPKFVEEQVERERQRRMQMLQQFTQQGLDPEELGIDPDEFTGGDELVEEVEGRVKADFLLLAIAENEDVEIGQEDLLSYIEHQASHSGMSPQQLMQSMMQDEEQLRQMNMMALLEKTKRLLLDHAEFEEVEPSEEEEVEEVEPSEEEEVEEDGAAEEDEDEGAGAEAEEVEEEGAEAREAEEEGAEDEEDKEDE